MTRIWRLIAWVLGKVSDWAEAAHDDLHETPDAGCVLCRSRATHPSKEETVVEP